MYSRYTPSRCIAKCTVTCVLSFYVCEWIVYHAVCTPVFGWALLFNGCLALGVWSYLATALTDPGTRETRDWQVWRLKCLATDPEAAAQVKKDGPQRRNRYQPGEITWCQECQEERPERAHHCSSCGFCILRMDHHCPWIGTCVGWRNHKHFILLNWWSSWASLLFILTLRGPNSIDALFHLIELGPKHSVWPAVGVIIAGMFLLITGGMWIFALSMVTGNVTAVEELFPDKNPYELPSMLDNVRQLLGPLDINILLPLEPTDRATGGTAWPLGPAAKAPDAPEPAGLAGHALGQAAGAGPAGAADDAAGKSVAAQSSESSHVRSAGASYGSL